jgi:hypothetical protein
MINDIVPRAFVIVASVFQRCPVWLRSLWVESLSHAWHTKRRRLDKTAGTHGQASRGCILVGSTVCAEIQRHEARAPRWPGTLKEWTVDTGKHFLESKLGKEKVNLTCRWQGILDHVQKWQR